MQTTSGFNTSEVAGTRAILFAMYSTLFSSSLPDERFEHSTGKVSSLKHLYCVCDSRSCHRRLSPEACVRPTAEDTVRYHIAVDNQC